MQQLQLEGQKFGFLTVIKLTGHDKNHHALWLCNCDCGGTATVRSGHLKQHQIACGRNCPLIPHPVKHGHTRGSKPTSEYSSWRTMMRRCYQKTFHQYKNYGAKGITVYKPWHDAETFLIAMGSKPTPQHTIDRFPNQTGNYEPGNVRWATKVEQTRNRRPVSEWKTDRLKNISIAAKAAWKKRKKQQSAISSPLLKVND